MISSRKSRVVELDREIGVGVDAINGSADVEALDEDMVDWARELEAPKGGEIGKSSSGGADIPSSVWSQSI
jgi:hypothetical protein